ncbi:MAG: LPS assembly lipoprotein LptE [Bacteroidales bacterium]|jgi:hypothetical protein|nr:LPS assembly lipoprotein LptE [Bacteroidales bacterium]
MLENKKNAVIIFTVLICVNVFFNSCRISYSFTGANLSPQIKTYSVYYFPNRSGLNPTLSQLFTEELRSKLQRQSPLKEITEDGDLIFEGFIESYDVKPMTIQQGDAAAQNRLTITIRIKYTNSFDTSQSFERAFSGYEDFSSSISLRDAEDSIVPTIVDKILEDLFNSTIANW